MPPIQRSKKLIQPGLQLRLIGFFVGLCALGLLLQFLLLGARLQAAVGALDDGGGQLADQVPGMMLGVLAFSFAIVLPIVFLIGLVLTFRIAGPAYRFESYLRSLARGEELSPCRIRENDELQSLCEAINEVADRLLAKRRELDPASSLSE